MQTFHIHEHLIWKIPSRAIVCSTEHALPPGAVLPPACAWAKTELREQEPVSDITFKLQMCHVCHVQRHALSVTGNTPYFRHSVKRLLVADGKSLILTCV